MLKANKLLNFIGIYLFFLSTLFFGLYFNEDFAGGAKYDFLIHKVAVEAFIDNFNYAFLNYDQFGNDHSPIYILFLYPCTISLGSFIAFFTAISPAKLLLQSNKPKTTISKNFFILIFSYFFGIFIKNFR